MTEVEAFKLLIDGCGPDRTMPISQIMARTDIEDGQKRADFWVRVTARLAAADMCLRRFRGRHAENKFIGFGEQQQEEWEQYIADEIYSREEPEEFARAKQEGLCYLLF